MWSEGRKVESTLLRDFYRVCQVQEPGFLSQKVVDRPAESSMCLCSGLEGDIIIGNQEGT